jgi:molecular chaperone GrpE
LERALTAQQTDVDSLRQGVELTYRSLMKLLEQEDVEPVAALGLPFNPEWHEAVGATTETSSGVPPQTVVEVLRPGYRLGNHLLRPARVIVST